CTLAVLSCNVVKSLGVRRRRLGHRQFADQPIEEVYLRPRQTSYGVGRYREPSREKGSRGPVPSTSTLNRAQANCRACCRTRQKERKQQPPQQRDSMWPPTSTVIACAFRGAKARPALRLSRKRVKICLPMCFCPADLGFFSTADPG